MKVVAIVIARMGSQRLPGKVLRTLGDKCVLSWVVSAARMAPGVDEVVVATTALPGDNAVEAWCEATNTPCFRGAENDVLSRFVGAAELHHATVAVRITADEPFVDPQVIGEVVRLQKSTGCDYASTVEPRTWADGMDIEAVSIKALRYAHSHASRPIDRECVTTFIARNRSRFPAEGVVCPIPGMHKERWTLDTADDFEFCSEIAKRLTRTPPSYLDILAILDKEPDLRKLNAHHPTNERYYDAIAQEEISPRNYIRSQIALQKAEAIIPLGAQTFSKSRLQFPQPSPLFVTHGQGATVWDVDGNEYIDLVSALLPNVLGYRDPDVDSAVRRQLSSGISFSLATELEASLAERLVRLIPCAEAVRFGKNGSDATSAAVRLARAFTGRSHVISHGYHGWHDWSVARTPRNKGVPDSCDRLAWSLPAGDCSYFETSLKDMKYAACIIEPEGWTAKQLRDLRDLCTKHGVVLIFDEVITGFRWSMGGAQAIYDVTPDLACFGKAMANGMPLSAVVGRKDIMKLMVPPDNIFYSGTFFGETLSLAASIATIDKMERVGAIQKLWDDGYTLNAGAVALVHKYGLDDEIKFSGSAPLIRLTFKSDKVKTLFIREMTAAGVLIIASHNVCYALTENDIKRVLKAYDYALGIIRDTLSKGDLDKRVLETVTPTVRNG